MSHTHFLQVTPSHRSQHALQLSFRLSVCSEDKKASERSVSAYVMPQDRTLKAGLFPQKAHLCEVCGPMSRDSLHLVEHQEIQHRQKLHTCGACGNRFHLMANLYQQHRWHVGEKRCKSSTNRALFLKSCKFQASGKSFTFKEVRKDFLGRSGHLQQQAPHTREKPNSRGDCAVAFHTVKSH